MEPASPQANRFLGIYLLVIAFLQAALYREVVMRGADGWSLYYLEPRLGLFFLESLVKPGHAFPGFLPGISAVALAAMAFLLLLEAVGLRAYLIFEIVLAMPTVILFGMIAVSNPPPGFSFSILDLALPAIPFAMTSILPVIYAWRVRTHLKLTET